ncbi:hypothetical protein DL240_16325 [Lujinxingia litoralis]|uniref:Uncharacterized protein n=1 Tax=Lujinxingia litoralis TaxID=2211119 RepID=A0A328C3U4_9DELT|nr:hypothetical protein DL240_16325 [Lujinxingia litoralis]
MAAATLLSLSCTQEYSLERQVPERGTLGEELHAIWLKDTRRMAELPGERSALLEARREAFVGAVDRAVPAGTEPELDNFLQAIVPAIEQGYFPAITRRLPLIMDEAAHDEELLDFILNRPEVGPTDYLSPRHQGRFFYELSNFDQSSALMGHLGRVLARHDGFDDQGNPDISQPSAGSDLLRALADALEEEPPEIATDRVSVMLRDLFVQGDATFLNGESSRLALVARFDERGLPQVRLRPDGSMPEPFIDSDRDGLADLDAQGRFHMTQGPALHIKPLSDAPSPHPLMQRDLFGRLQFGQNDFVFEYVDLSETALPFLVELGAGLAAEDALYHGAATARELLGPAVVGEDARGHYPAFSPEHPMVDVVDAIISGLSITELPEVMELSARYMRRSSQGMAHLSFALSDAIDAMEDVPAGELGENSTLVHDLLPVLREISADPALWADVFEALRDPIMERSGEAMLTLLRHKNMQAVPAAEGPYNACFEHCDETQEIGTVARFECIRACPSQEIFREAMDYTLPESPENRSMFQRVFHLLRDTAQTPYVMHVEEVVVPGFDMMAIPPMLELPGSAEAFIKSVAGDLVLTDYISDEFTNSDLGQMLELIDELVPGVVDDETVGGMLSIASELFGARLDPSPTPAQITRLFNQPRLRFEDAENGYVLEVTSPTCRDGYVMAAHHADGLYAAEASGLIDVLHPLAKAFSRHDREELLMQIFVVIHDHYSSRVDLYYDKAGNRSPMKGANLVSLEPALDVIFERGHLFAGLRALALSTGHVRDDQGVHVDERLRQLIHAWLRNDDAYTTRAGESSLELADGRTLSPVSRVDIIVDRLAHMVDRADADAEVKGHLADFAEGFLNVVLRAEEDPEGGYRFHEPGTIALATHVLDYTAQRAREMEARGEFEGWLTEKVPDALMEIFTSRWFFAAVELVAALHDEPQGRQVINDALNYLGNDADRADQSALMIYALMVQAFDLEELAPVARFALQSLDPDRRYEVEGPHAGLPTATLIGEFMARAGELDPDGEGVRIMGRGSIQGEEYDASWVAIGDLVLRYFSDDPHPDRELNREDIRSGLSNLGDWLLQEERGLERYYKLVEHRRRLLDGK